MAGTREKEPGFLFCVGAEQELARLCPGGDLRRLREMLSGRTADSISAAIELLCILSRWHEKAQAREIPGYEPDPLTREELELIPDAQFQRLQAAALAAMVRDQQQTVEAEGEKKDEAPRSS